MVRVIKAIIDRKPADLVKLKFKARLIFGRNIRKVNKRKEVNNVRTKYQNLQG